MVLEFIGLSLVNSIVPAVTSLTFAVPAIIAARKKLYSEAFIVAFAAFFQIIFHLSKIPLISLLFQFFGGDLLDYFSTYGLVLSVYVTLVQLTPLSNAKTNLLRTTGGLTISVGVYQKAESLTAVMGPVMLILVLIAALWCQKMWQKKSLYPAKDKWLKVIIPAMALGATSVVLRLFENSSNYMIIHSLHLATTSASMALLMYIADEGEELGINYSKCCSVIKCYSCCCCC